MSWQSKFGLGTLQETIERALQTLNPLAVADPVKQGRMRRAVRKIIEKKSDSSEIDLSGQTRYWYTITGQVAHFVQVTEEPNFSGLERLLRENADKFSYAREIIDYGCGNGVKGSWVYHLLNEASQRGQPYELVLVDPNENILQVASSVATELCGTCETEEPLNLEESYLKRTRDDEARLHLFLGQTIGNFEDPRPVVANLAKSMKKGEYLIVEWFNRDHQVYETGRQDDGSYAPASKGARNLEFLYSYFEQIGIPRTILRTDDGHFMRSERTLKGVWNIGYLTLTEDFTHPSGVTLSAGTRLIGLRSRQFENDSEIVKLFEKYGLKGEYIASHLEMRLDPIEAGIARRLGTEAPIKEMRIPDKVMSDADKCYAVFKKTNNFDLQRKVKGALAILAVGIGITTSAFLYTLNQIEEESVIHCDVSAVDNFTLQATCDGKQETFYAEDLEEIVDEGSSTNVSSSNVIYSFTYKGFLEYVMFQKSMVALDVLKEAASDRKVKGMDACDYYFRYHPSETIKLLGACTHDVKLLARISDFMSKYKSLERVRERVISETQRIAFEQRNSEGLISLVNFFNDPRCLDLLTRSEQEKQESYEIMAFLYSCYGVDHDFFEAALELTSFHVNAGRVRYLPYSDKKPDTGLSLIFNILEVAHYLERRSLKEYFGLVNELKGHPSASDIFEELKGIFSTKDTNNLYIAIAPPEDEPEDPTEDKLKVTNRSMGLSRGDMISYILNVVRKYNRSDNLLGMVQTANAQSHPFLLFDFTFFMDLNRDCVYDKVMALERSGKNSQRLKEYLQEVYDAAQCRIRNACDTDVCNIPL